jgi:hypothetical protein
VWGKELNSAPNYQINIGKTAKAESGGVISHSQSRAGSGSQNCSPEPEGSIQSKLPYKTEKQ